jgi:hypothetical protein
MEETPEEADCWSGLLSLPCIVTGLSQMPGLGQCHQKRKQSSRKLTCAPVRCLRRAGLTPRRVRMGARRPLIRDVI